MLHAEIAEPKAVGKPFEVIKVDADRLTGNDFEDPRLWRAPDEVGEGRTVLGNHQPGAGEEIDLLTETEALQPDGSDTRAQFIGQSRADLGQVGEAAAAIARAAIHGTGSIERIRIATIDEENVRGRRCSTAESFENTLHAALDARWRIGAGSVESLESHGLEPEVEWQRHRMREMAVTVREELRAWPQRAFAKGTRQRAERSVRDWFHTEFDEQRSERARIAEHPLAALPEGRGQGEQWQDVAEQEVIVVLMRSVQLGGQQERADRRRHERDSQERVRVRVERSIIPSGWMRCRARSRLSGVAQSHGRPLVQGKAMPIHHTLAHLRDRLGWLRARIRDCAGLESMPPSRRRSDPFKNMKTYIPADERAVIFDVGANKGQSIRSFRAAFPLSTIHSFEPSPEVFARELLPRHGKRSGVHLWNMAVGSAEGTMSLRENSSSGMTSFLAPGEAWWGSMMRTTSVPVTTLDAFAARNDVGFIHILKSDTQGFDLEVLKGAERLLSEGRVGMIYVEITLAKLYEGLPSFDVMERHLADRGFSLAGLYEMHVRDGLLGWMDALFIRNAFHAERHRDVPGRIERLS